MRATACIVMLFMCFALLGCKSRKSHLEKSTTESVQTNHEVNNLDVQATSFKMHNTSLTVDSNWMNAISLVNFTGTIFNTGKVQGSVDQAEVRYSGNKKQQEGQATLQLDSTLVNQNNQKESSNKQKERNTVDRKETKAIKVHWLILGLVSVPFLIKAIYNRIKSKFNPF